MKEVYSTPVDLRIMTLDFIRSVTHSSTIFVDDPRATMALLRARGIIDLKLGNVVSGVTTFETTPYASPVLKPAADENGSGENTGTCSMLGLIPNSTAITEQWQITFTSTTAFSATGSISGAQGTGTAGTAFTSTNGMITIPTDAFTGTQAIGNDYYIAVYKHIPEIVLLSTMLATGLIYKGSAAGTAPGLSAEGAKLYDDAMKLLDSIVKGDSGLLGISYDLDTTDLQTIYEISPLGFDSSNYAQDPVNKYATSTYGNTVWWTNL